MKLKKFKMEDWFIDSAHCKYNFSESGVPDFNLNDFLKITKTKNNILEELSLGNNSTWGSKLLRERISRLYNKVKPENVIVGNGTSEVLYIFYNLFLNKNSKVLILHPAFPLLHLIPEALDSKVYFLDVLKCVKKEALLEDLKENIRKIKPDLLIINTPHNPVGFSFDESEIIEITKEAKKQKTTLLFDEHYRFLPMSSSESISVSGYDVAKRIYNKVLATGSVIKCTGIVGIRVGWFIAPIALLKKMRDYKDYTTHCTPLISESIASIAIKNASLITKDFIKNIKINWHILKSSELVKSGNMELNFELEGGCVCFPRVVNIDTGRLAKILAQKYSMSVMPGEVFEKPGYIRINLAQRKKDFELLLININKIIKNGKL